MVKNCRFCLSNNLLDDAPLFENGSFYVLGMREPDRQHALMIVTKAHTETPFDIKPEDWAEIAAPLEYVRSALAIFRPTGYSVGWNVGVSGGQHVNHAHLHVICRFDDQSATGLGINALIQRANDAVDWS